MTRPSVALLLGTLLPAAVASAHPLGNFTTNRAATIRVRPGTVEIAYAIDFAEIPSYRELRALDADGDGTTSAVERDAYLAATASDVARHLQVMLDGAPVELAPVLTSLEIGRGAGNLPTVRVDLTMRGGLGAQRGTLAYDDRNFPDRPGWQEVIATGGEGLTLSTSTVPAADRSQQLRAYPQDLLATPPQVTTATIGFAPGASASTAASPTPAGATSDGRLRDRLTEMIASTTPLSGSVLITSLLIAAALGALHALTPGHGKSVVGAYLVGSRGTWKHAVFLGLVVTATHTLGVYALGLVTLTASHWIVPERLLPWLSIVSGLLVLGIGATLVVSRLAAVLQTRAHDHGHDHAHDHDHGHHHHPCDDGEHGHSHAPPSFDGGVSWRNLLALGVSGGLLPCPSALVVMLGAIALGRVGFGLLLIVAFSAGLAAVLTAIGLLMVYARRAFDRLPLDGRLARYMPVASAVVISIAGLLIVVEALGQIGI